MKNDSMRIKNQMYSCGKWCAMGTSHQKRCDNVEFVHGLRLGTKGAFRYNIGADNNRRIAGRQMVIQTNINEASLEGREETDVTVSSINRVLEEISYLEKIRNECTAYMRKTACYKGCSLSTDRRRKKPLYTVHEKKNGKMVGTYVGERNKKVDIIITRHIYKFMLHRIDQDLKWLQQVDAKYLSINPNDFRSELPYAYREIPEAFFKTVGVVDMSKIKPSGASEGSAFFHPENLIHTAADGDRRRSRGELLLGYILDKLGISYTYEKEIYINGHKVIPDFYLTSPDGSKEIILEYFGMMNDSYYRAKNAEKIRRYINAGYIPGKTILFIYDEKDGSFDAQMIERMLREWAGIKEAA